MTLTDLIEVYNMNSGRSLDDIDAFFADIDIDERLDKDILIDSLLDECGAMNAIYTTTGVFKRFSDNFFKKYKWNIGKLLDTLELRYDPLANNNLEWTETTEIEQQLNTSEEAGEDRTKTNTGTQGIANSGTQGNVYTDNKEDTVSAMNSDTYQPDTNSASSGSNTRTDNLNELRTDNLSEVIDSDRSRTKDESLDWSETDTHKETGAKNVVLQDLIEKERKVAQFSIYNWISKKYASELFLLVY